jgi:hypothetical protein
MGGARAPPTNYMYSIQSSHRSMSFKVQNPKRLAMFANLQNSVILIAIVVSNKIVFFLELFSYLNMLCSTSVGLVYGNALNINTDIKDLPGCYDLRQYQPYNNTSSPVGTRDLR